MIKGGEMFDVSDSLFMQQGRGVRRTFWPCWKICLLQFG